MPVLFLLMLTKRLECDITPFLLSKQGQILSQCPRDAQRDVTSAHVVVKFPRSLREERG